MIFTAIEKKSSANHLLQEYCYRHNFDVRYLKSFIESSEIEEKKKSEFVLYATYDYNLWKKNKSIKSLFLKKMKTLFILKEFEQKSKIILTLDDNLLYFIFRVIDEKNNNCFSSSYKDLKIKTFKNAIKNSKKSSSIKKLDNLISRNIIEEGKKRTIEYLDSQNLNGNEKFDQLFFIDENIINEGLEAVQSVSKKIYNNLKKVGFHYLNENTSIDPKEEEILKDNLEKFDSVISKYYKKNTIDVEMLSNENGENNSESVSLLKKAVLMDTIGNIFSKKSIVSSLLMFYFLKNILLYDDKEEVFHSKESVKSSFEQIYFPYKKNAIPSLSNITSTIHNENNSFLKKITESLEIDSNHKTMKAILPIRYQTIGFEINLNKKFTYKSFLNIFKFSTTCEKSSKLKNSIRIKSKENIISEVLHIHRYYNEEI